MANEDETTTGQPQWVQTGQQAATNASGLLDDNSLVGLLALVLMAAFSPMASRASHAASQGPHHAVRDTVPEAEKGAWKDLEAAYTNYYRKGHEHQDVSGLVANSMREAEESISGLSPELRKHFLGLKIEGVSVLSERKDRQLAGIQEPAIDLREALAKRREMVKQWHIKIDGQSEAEANKRVDAWFPVREEKLDNELRKEGASDSEIAQSTSDSAEAHRRYFAKLEAKSHEHSAAHGNAPKTLEEAAREFAKHAPKLPSDPNELAKMPTGHPDGQFQPPAAAGGQPNRGPRGRP
jgi:hypothetical protein